MTVLITGGAGYLGTHLARWLSDGGHSIAVLDDLTSPLYDPPRVRAPLITVDVRNFESVRNVLVEHAVTTVVHLAAESWPAVSVRNPLDCYSRNLCGTVSLLQAMKEATVGRLVFASSCAVYGNPDAVPVSETCSVQPVSPYGWSKLFAEQAIHDAVTADQGLTAVVLRLFNVAGGDSGPTATDGSPASARVIPAALNSILNHSDGFEIRGTDLPTPDGTCVRDFVHINDVCHAFEQSIRRLDDQGDNLSLENPLIVNIGSGRATSVREIDTAVESVVGRPMTVHETARTRGDAAAIVAQITRAAEELEWAPRSSCLNEIIRDALSSQE